MGAGARGGNVGSGGAGGGVGVGGGTSGGAGTTGGNAGTGAADAGTVDTCSLPAEAGVCLAAMTRFYFDPVTARCRQFTYGGCGGNLNNFMNLTDCEAKCSHRAKSCRMCGTDSCEPHMNCSTCPVNGEATGEPCSTPGFECNYGHCGPICTCREDADGRTWRCIVLPC